MAEKYITKKGTTFVNDDGRVTISRTKQSPCDVPLKDLEEFVEKHASGDFESVPNKREEDGTRSES